MTRDGTNGTCRGRLFGPTIALLFATGTAVSFFPQATAQPGKELPTVKPGSVGAAPGKTGPARAAAKARALILLTQANRKLRRGFYLEALELFKKAYKLYPSPKLHFNIAQTYMEVGRTLKALNHYEQFVRKIKKQDVTKMLWNLAHARIFQLMGKIATVQLLTNVADVKVSADGRPVGTTPLSKPLRFLPGAHMIVVSKSGYEKKVVELKLKAGQSVTRRIKLLRPEQAAATRRIVTKIRAEKRKIQTEKKKIQLKLELERRTSARKERRIRRALHLAGWANLGAGLAVAALGGLFGILFQVEADKVEKAGTNRTWTDVKKHFDLGNYYKRGMVIGLGIGGALAVGGGVLLTLRYLRKEKPVAKTHPTPSTPKPAVSALPAFGPGRLGLNVKVDF